MTMMLDFARKDNDVRLRSEGSIGHEDLSLISYFSVYLNININKMIMFRSLIFISTLFFSYNIQSQNVGVDIENPNYKLDVNGFSGSDNQISIIPLWQTGSNYTMNNTSGSDLVNCESGLEPTAYDSAGNIEVKLVIRITSTSAGTTNFQLRTHDGTTQSFPIVNIDSWTFSNTQTGQVAISPWKDWSAGTNFQEVHLFGWVDSGSANFNSAYLMVRPNR